MNKFQGIRAPEQLEKGDIIRFRTQGTAMERRDNPWGQGYLQEIVYASQQGDTVIELRILPIVPAQDALNTDFNFKRINHKDTGATLGLDPNKEWAVLLAPLRIQPTAEQTGCHDGMVERLGNIAGTVQESFILENLERFGDHSAYGGPREARPNASSWGLYRPLGVVKDRFEEAEYVQEPKRQYRKKPAFEGKVLDIDIELAVERLGLDETVAKLFTQPVDGRVKKVTTLRDAYELDADSLEKYIPKETGLDEDVSLDDLTDVEIDGEVYDEINYGVVQCLKTPRKGASVKPVLNLKDAYELVTQRPEDLAQYDGMGKKTQQAAIEDITNAYNARAASIKSEDRTAAVKSAVKAAWTSLGNSWLESEKTGEVPENLRGADSKPVWTMEPRKP